MMSTFAGLQHYVGLAWMLLCGAWMLLYRNERHRRVALQTEIDLAMSKLRRVARAPEFSVDLCPVCAANVAIVLCKQGFNDAPDVRITR